MPSITFQLPTGPKNLSPLFPAVNFKNVAEYYVQLKAGSTVIATTNRFKKGCCCNNETLRLFFVNFSGGIDAAVFSIATREADIKSTSWKKANTHPLRKWDGGRQRQNITGNITVLAESVCYAETDQDWLTQLFSTPLAWLQWTGIEGQGDDYINVVVEDGKFLTRKEDGRHVYVTQVQFTMANELFLLRS